MDELSIVRVVRLNSRDRHFDGSESVARPPRIGDVGTVVHKSGDLHIVESVDTDGHTVWLEDFSPDELEEVIFPLSYGRNTMDQRIESVISDMTAVAEDARATFSTLTNAQLNWKPAEKSWSVGQCLDHIIKTNHEFDPEFERLASGNRKNSFWEHWSPFTGMGGRFLVNAVKTDSKKAKAPSKSIVPPSAIDADIVNRFVEHIADVNRKVEACSGVDLQKTVVTSPFLSVLTYKFDDALTVLVEHSKRHVRQAKRVMEADGFPR